MTSRAGGQRCLCNYCSSGALVLLLVEFVIGLSLFV